jgi:hypothetical protein
VYGRVHVQIYCHYKSRTDLCLGSSPLTCVDPWVSLLSTPVYGHARAVWLKKHLAWLISSSINGQLSLVSGLCTAHKGETISHAYWTLSGVVLADPLVEVEVAGREDQDANAPPYLGSRTFYIPLRNLAQYFPTKWRRSEGSSADRESEGLVEQHDVRIVRVWQIARLVLPRCLGR